MRLPLGALKPFFESGALFQLKLEHFCWRQEQLIAPGLVDFFELTPLDGARLFSRRGGMADAVDSKSTARKGV